MNITPLSVYLFNYLEQELSHQKYNQEWLKFGS